MSICQFVDLDSTRNLTILGVSLILGLMVPQFINDPQNAGAIDTGTCSGQALRGANTGNVYCC